MRQWHDSLAFLIKAGTIPKVMRVIDKPKGWDVRTRIAEGWGVDQLNGFIVRVRPRTN